MAFKFQFDLETLDEKPLRGMNHCKVLFIFYSFNGLYVKVISTKASQLNTRSSFFRS